MKFINATTRAGLSALKKLNRRAEPETSTRETVATVLADIRVRGDAAVIEYTRQFDRAELSAGSLGIPAAALAAAWKRVPAATKRVLQASHRNVAAFARAGLRKSWSRRNEQGARVGEIYQGFDRVGLYVPGGTAPLVSTAIMTVTLAKMAGCREIVVTTPCGSDGSVNPALLAALHLAGATEVWRIGGIQAIGALAYGTQSIRPVAKIFGPGNKFVIEAKRQVFGLVAVDQLPGPSEVMVLADETGHPAWIAADLVAQAEHGHGSQAVLVTPSRELADAVAREVDVQLKSLSRQESLAQALKTGGFIVLAEDMAQAITIANDYASEHLSLIVKDSRAVVRQITTAGAIFIGNHSPVAVGDYLAGPSHTLPTGGAGKSFAGLTVDQFQRRTSVVQLDAASIRKSAPLVKALSDLEGLDAHGRSAMIRLECLGS
jgi:histidinol dehydrogenase